MFCFVFFNFLFFFSAKKTADFDFVFLCLRATIHFYFQPLTLFAVTGRWKYSHCLMLLCFLSLSFSLSLSVSLFFFVVKYDPLFPVTFLPQTVVHVNLLSESCSFNSGLRENGLWPAERKRKRTELSLFQTRQPTGREESSEHSHTHTHARVHTHIPPPPSHPKKCAVSPTEYNYLMDWCQGSLVTTVESPASPSALKALSLK